MSPIKKGMVLQFLLEFILILLALMFIDILNDVAGRIVTALNIAWIPLVDWITLTLVFMAAVRAGAYLLLRVIGFALAK